MSDYSEFLSEGFTPNPYYDKMLSLLVSGNTELLEAIVEAGESCDLGPYGNDIPASLVDSLVEKFDEQLEHIIDVFEDTPLVDPYMPPAPHSVVLYGRLEQDGKYLDLGSGDGRKAEKAKVNDLVLSDLAIPEGRFSKRWVIQDATDDRTLRERAVSRMLTSHMTLTQLQDIEAVMSQDGIHIVPDVGFLMRVGGVDLGDKVRVRTRNQRFEDYKHDFGGGFQLSPGYIGVMSYKQQSVWVELACPSRMKPPDGMPISNARFNIDVDATPKYDGVRVHFTLRADGTGFAVNRKGLGYRLKHNLGHDCRFVAEHCRDVYVLIRLLSYRGVVPWHDVSSMELFCSRKRFDIGGEHLCGPKSAKVLKLKTDGLISRIGEEDYRVKDYVGVDLNAASWGHYMDRLGETSDAYVMADPPVDDKIVEYSYVMEDGVHVFNKLRHRPDKNTCTSFSEFQRMRNTW